MSLDEKKYCRITGPHFNPLTKMYFVGISSFDVDDPDEDGSAMMSFDLYHGSDKDHANDMILNGNRLLKRLGIDAQS